MMQKSGLRRGTKTAIAALAFGLSAGLLVSTPARADFDEGMQAYLAGQYQKSLDTWKRYALAGDIRSKKVLGDVYSGKPLTGVAAPAPLEEIPVNNVKALLWYTLAAYHNFSDYREPSTSEINDKIIAEQRLPEIRGRMSSKHVSEAEELIIQQFQSGTGYDLYNLGLMFQRGAGLPKDNSKALQMFSLARDRGVLEATAAYELLEGLVTTKERKDAEKNLVDWRPPLPIEYNKTTSAQAAFEAEKREFEKTKLAAALKRVDEIEVELIQRALNALGFRAGIVDNELGRGTRAAIRRFQYSLVEFDSNMSEEQKRETITGKLTAEQTVKLFNNAAQNDDPMSQYIYGVMHVSGIGVNPDGKRAVSWLEKAADQNMAIAHNALGRVYRDGTLGANKITPNQTRSAFHFAKAAALGYTPANKSLEKLSFELPNGSNK